MSARPTLPEAVKIAEWWKNRSGETIRLDLSTFEGVNIVNLRTWFTEAGALRPGKKGFACAVKHLPRLADAFAKARDRAMELGLIDGADAIEGADHA